MKISSLSLAAAVAAVLGGMTVAANAQNTLHGPADLVLTFQNPGGLTGSNQTVTVVLGATSTVFRDAAPGSFTLLNTANISNLGTILTNTFGANWWEASTLWMGAIAYRGSADPGTDAAPGTSNLLTGDPQQTLYFTKNRSVIGNVGEANTIAPTVISGSGSGITSTMEQVKGRVEGGGNTAILVDPTSSSSIDNNNPYVGGNPAFGQDTAYTNIAGGIQGRFGANSLGTFGAAGVVELALDLYRVQYRSNIAGQAGFGEPVRQGDFLGTLTINESGQVGFLAVPEPTTASLLGFAAAGLLGMRRRRNA